MLGSIREFIRVFLIGEYFFFDGSFDRIGLYHAAQRHVLRNSQDKLIQMGER